MCDSTCISRATLANWIRSMFEGMCAGIVHTSDNKETDMTGQL